MGIVTIKKNSGTPKYKQIVASIEEAILDGRLKNGDKIPSLNHIKNQHSLSRDTVLTAFNELKTRGILESIVGKGYYISSENIKVSQKIFLLFDEFNSFKEDLYNSLVTALGDTIQVDIFFHHFNLDVFKRIINDNAGAYSHYVIMPANLKNTDAIIERLPQEKVYILDQTHAKLSQYTSIFQNFKKDMYQGLQAGLSLINKYSTIILIFDKKKQPQGLLDGFSQFCLHHAIPFKILDNLNNCTPQIGELYVLLDDKSLIKVIKKIKEGKLTLAKDVGIISYNDTLLKEIVENGITTISTDFNYMGKRLAQMILDNESGQVENPNTLIIRNSI